MVTSFFRSEGKQVSDLLSVVSLREDSCHWNGLQFAFSSLNFIMNLTQKLFGWSNRATEIEIPVQGFEVWTLRQWASYGFRDCTDVFSFQIKVWDIKDFDFSASQNDIHKIGDCLVDTLVVIYAQLS